jgi:hypothetical protein
MVKSRLVFAKQFYLIKDRGQSTVEYILLLAVIVFVVNAVFQSNLFKDFFGTNGKFAKSFRAETEFSYRHTLRGREFYSTPNYNGTHKSYIHQGATTRFFGAMDAYPKQ